MDAVDVRVGHPPHVDATGRPVALFRGQQIGLRSQCSSDAQFVQVPICQINNLQFSVALVSYLSLVYYVFETKLLGEKNQGKSLMGEKR